MEWLHLAQEDTKGPQEQSREHKACDLGLMSSRSDKDLWLDSGQHQHQLSTDTDSKIPLHMSAYIWEPHAARRKDAEGGIVRPQPNLASELSESQCAHEARKTIFRPRY